MGAGDGKLRIMGRLAGFLKVALCLMEGSLNPMDWECPHITIM